MSVAQPVARPVVRGVARSVLGGGLAPALAMLVPRADGTIDSDIVRGVSPATFARASVGYVQDWEGIYRPIPAEVARFQGCRWEPATNTFHWQLADGTPLHPTHVEDGVRVFDHYRRWAASTAYSVGDRIIPDLDTGTAGGNGYWYECTAAGTSDSVQPAWPTASFGVDTVADGTATWTLKGYYRVAGYYTEGARTNSLLDSRDFGSANWILSGGVSLTQTEIGIDGVINTAWYATDNSTTSIATVFQEIAIPDDTATHTLSVFIQKDSDETRYPHIRLIYLNGVSAVRNRLTLNTKTGEFVTNNRGGVFRVDSHGIFWKITVAAANNGTGNTLLRALLRPAYSTTLSDSPEEDIATGSAVFDQAQIELNVGNGAFATTPIVTTDAPVTRAQDTLTLAAEGHYTDDGGALMADYSSGAPVIEDFGFVVGAGDKVRNGLRQRNKAGGAALFDDGVNTFGSGPVVNGGNIRAGARWDDTGQQLAYGDRITPVNTDAIGGPLSETGAILLGDGLAGTRIHGTIRNIRLYTRDVGEARLKALSDYD